MSRNYLSFKGKVVIVTGSTRGIGKAIADLLHQWGGSVVYTGTKDKKQDSSQVFPQYWPLDLADEESVESFCRKIRGLASIDVLVNNAGINHIEPIERVSLTCWENILKVNLTGAMRLTREVATMMKKKGRSGKILNISSIFGLISRNQRDAYSASKAGLIGLTKASALDLAKDNILVNALCPGFTLTDLTETILSKREMRRLSQQIPLGRLAGVGEIAYAAAFLCSDLNTYITGQTVVVDGGFVIE